MRLKTMATPRYLPDFMSELKSKVEAAQGGGQDIECIYINRDEAYTMMVNMKRQKVWIKGETLKSIEDGSVALNYLGIDVRVQ
jgi:hypothetical protein